MERSACWAQCSSSSCVPETKARTLEEIELRTLSLD